MRVTRPRARGRGARRGSRARRGDPRGAPARGRGGASASGPRRRATGPRGRGQGRAPAARGHQAHAREERDRASHPRHQRRRAEIPASRSPAWRARPPAERQPRRARLRPGRDPGVRGGHRNPHPLPLRRAQLGRPHGAAREDRFLPRQLQRDVRPRHGRDGRRGHPRAEEATGSTRWRSSISSTRARWSRGPSAGGSASSGGRAALVVRRLARPHPQEDRRGRHHRASVLRLSSAGEQGHQRSLVVSIDVLRVRRRHRHPPGHRLRRQPPELGELLRPHAVLAPPGQVPEQGRRAHRGEGGRRRGPTTRRISAPGPPSATTRPSPSPPASSSSEKVHRGILANVGIDLALHSLSARHPPPAPARAGRGLQRPRGSAAEHAELGIQRLAGRCTPSGSFGAARQGTRIVPGLRADYSSPVEDLGLRPAPGSCPAGAGARDFPRTVLAEGRYRPLLPAAATARGRSRLRHARAHGRPRAPGRRWLRARAHQPARPLGRRVLSEVARTG